MSGRRVLPAAVLLAALLAAPASGAAQTPAPRLVAAVTFSPADRAGPYRFAELVAVRAGDPLAPDAVERSLRLLRASGLFAEVGARVEDADAGAVVAFTLTPHPLVRAVRVKGNFLVLESTLSPMLRLRAAEPFRDEIVRADVERVLRHYEEQGYLGTRVTDEVSRSAAGVDVTYHIREGRPRVVRDVVPRGNKGVGEREVLAAFGLNRLTFYRDVDLQRGLENLRDFYQRLGYLDVRVASRVDESAGVLGFLAVLFNPIKGLLTLGPDGYRLVTITLEIDEGRRYEISVRGSEAYSEKELLPLLTFQRSGFFDEEEVAAGRERILTFYQNRGYYLAEVDARADYDAGRVVYVVREHKPVPVAEVRLRGFVHFAGDWVRRRLATVASAGEDLRLLRADDLERDRRRIEGWYRAAGFPRAEVPQPEVWPEAGPAGAVVVFSVTEGPRSLVRHISFSGNLALTAAELRAAARLGEGKPYRAAELQAAADRVRVAYEHAGYSGARVAVRPDFGDGRADVDLRFTVEEGRLQRLGAVAVTGNGRTKRGIVVRELSLKRGEPLDAGALAQAKNRLYDLGLFREVRLVLPEQVSPESPQDLIFAVRERPTGFVGFGAGYASDEQIRGFVEAGEQNLFGTGRGLRWKTKVSTLGHRHDVFYQEPWLLNYDVQGQADLYLERRDEIGYQVSRRGVTLGVKRELSRRLLLNLRYRYEFVDYSDVVHDLIVELGPLQSFNLGSVGAAVDYDRRDNAIAPRQGSYHLASVEVARPLFGGDASFTKYQLETSWYHPLWPGAEAALGLRGGFTQLILGSGDLPLSERFFLGGDRSVRGFGYREIGPKDAAGDPLGGNIFALGNVELRFGISGKLRGVLFLDAGELWADQAGLPSSGLRAAAGGGLRYETLVGPVRLEWGRKLKPEPGESPSRWHLTIGYPF